ncbi:2-C-methyl-D-erythritol 4-phosphate cytidylyltransferase [Nocardioides gilvus]|uniref:2-C-methyl-D-erythritol 4-phosphate cytidylyltransferase n=1 Tax=Nocardioides gilvus TaxID=1735589 RepID=UPI000D74ECA6|nr:2-C-methyl-D-erythritol 4-phosphate cytidylyltransferase [Nocardioides gilvus]
MSQTPDFFDLDDLQPLGLLLEEGRGSLPFALLHGEALVACAAWALGEAGVHPIDSGIGWEEIAYTGEPVVLHDPLCPMTPAEFIAACVVRAVTEDVVVVAVRPVTDTVKVVADGVVGETVDREGLRTICSPIVLPASVVAALPSLPSVHFEELVPMLREHFKVELVPAPAEARRVTSVEDVAVLEALTRR